MQTVITVVNLIHDIRTEQDTPVCWAFPGCSWRETRGTASSGDPTRTTHIRIPAGIYTNGYLPYAQWAALSATQKRKHWTLKRGWKILQGEHRTLTEREYAAAEKTCTCCTVSEISDDREPLLPHWHIEGS